MSRICFALVATLVSLSTAMAAGDGDLDALLGELTFGESNPAEFPAPLLMPSDPQARELVPPPSRQLVAQHDSAAEREAAQLPNSAPEMIEASQLQTPAPAAAGDGVNSSAPEWVGEEPEFGLSDPAPLQDPLRGNLTDEPVTRLRPQPMGPLAYGAPMAESLAYEPIPYGAVQGVPVGYGPGTCQAEVACIPHRSPTLPPPSSLLGYYQSDDCYSDIWAGYASERQARCDLMHDHIHGRCDCFDPAKRHWGWGSRAKCQGNCDCPTATR